MQVEGPGRQRPLVHRIFVSEDEPRLRTGWRLLCHALLAMSLSMCLGIPFVLGYAAYGLVGGEMDMSDLLVLSTLISAPAFTLATWIARRFLDRRPFLSLGLLSTKRTLPDLLAGLLISAVQMAFIFFFEVGMGWISVQGWAWETLPWKDIPLRLIGWLLLFVAVGFYEELTFRGYYLQNLGTGLSLPWAVAISSALFGLLHLSNPNASWSSTLGILLAGLFLAFAWMQTRQLWLPIGLHVGWNFFQGTVFGFPVSGTSGFHLIRQQSVGPVFFTGGAFGPEAGLVLLPALLLGFGLVFLYGRGRGTPGPGPS